MLAHLGALRHRGDDVGAHVLGVRAGVAHAPDPVDGGDRPQQLGEGRPPLARQVAAVGVDVLAQQRHLAHAVGGEALDLGDHVRGGAAALAAADGRHDAVGADAVAADRDLHPRLVGPLAHRRQAPAEGAVEAERADGVEPLARDQLAQARHLAGPEGDVDEGELLEDALLLALRPAAADGHDRVGALALDPLGVAQVAEEALVGAPPDRAGVEEDQVRVVAAVRRRVADPLEHAPHPLGVVVVHLAPEGGQVIPHAPDLRAPPR